MGGAEEASLAGNQGATTGSGYRARVLSANTVSVSFLLEMQPLLTGGHVTSCLQDAHFQLLDTLLVNYLCCNVLSLYLQ